MFVLFPENRGIAGIDLRARGCYLLLVHVAEAMRWFSSRPVRCVAQQDPSRAWRHSSHHRVWRARVTQLRDRRFRAQGEARAVLSLECSCAVCSV